MRKIYIRPTAISFEIAEEEEMLSGSYSANVDNRDGTGTKITITINGETISFNSEEERDKWIEDHPGIDLGSKAISWSNIDIDNW